MTKFLRFINRKLISRIALLSTAFGFAFPAYSVQLLLEDFNTGIPVSWTITNNGTANTWLGTSGGFDVSAAFGGASTFGSYLDASTEFIICDSETAGQTSDETIESPSVNAAGYSSVTLKFDQIFDNFTPDNSNDFGYVEVFNGSWTIVATFGSNQGTFLPVLAPGGVPIVDNQSIDISAHANAGLKVRFRYVNGNVNARWWGLDNIEIIGSAGSSAPDADFSAAPVTGCILKDTVTLEDLSAFSPTSWSWTLTPATGFSYVGSTNANSQFPKIVFNQGGAFDVKLFVSNATGSDSLTRSAFINIDDHPTVDAGADFNMCSSDLSAVSLSGAMGGSATGVVWTSTGGIITPNINISPDFTPDSDSIPGVIEIILTSSGGECDAVSDTLLATYSAAPVISVGSDVTICYGEDITLSGSVADATGLSWVSTGNGTFDDNTSLTPTFTPDAADSGMMQFTATSVGGCSFETDTMDVTIIMSDSCSMTGLKVEFENSISIFPIPANDFLNIEIESDLAYNLNYNLVNVMGQAVRHGKLNNSLNRIKVDQLNQGVYFLQILRMNETMDYALISTQKVVIR